MPRPLWILIAPLLCLMSAHAQVTLTGSSLRRGGKLLSCALGSITAGARASQGEPATAILMDAQGEERQVSCGIEVYPGEAEGTEQVIWRIALPEPLALTGLRIQRGSELLARLDAPANPPAPTVEFIETPGTDGPSVSWILQRPKKFADTSYWVRWSMDEGRTWEAGGLLYAADQLTVTFAHPHGTVLRPGMRFELWVPTGLSLRTFVHTVGRR